MTTEQRLERNKFKFKSSGPLGRGTVELNGAPLRNIRRIAMTGDVTGITTVELTLTGCETEWEADEMVYVNVTDITDDSKRYVRIPVDDYLEMWNAGVDMGRHVRELADAERRG